MNLKKNLFFLFVEVRESIQHSVITAFSETSREYIKQFLVFSGVQNLQYPTKKQNIKERLSCQSLETIRETTSSNLTKFWDCGTQSKNCYLKNSAF